jgi:hypothetical protein
MPASQGSA